MSGREDVCLALGAYLVGSLAPSERAAFDAHLAACVDCRVELAEMKPLLVQLSCVDVAEWRNRATTSEGSRCHGSSRWPTTSGRSGGVGSCGGRRQAWWPRWPSR